MEIGIDSFISTSFDAARRSPELDAARVRDLLAEIELADRTGNETPGGIARMTILLDTGPLPAAKRLRAVELLGTRVAPLVRQMSY